MAREQTFQDALEQWWAIPEGRVQHVTNLVVFWAGFVPLYVGSVAPVVEAPLSASILIEMRRKALLDADGDDLTNYNKYVRNRAKTGAALLRLSGIVEFARHRPEPPTALSMGVIP
jgi:hypothetical protein